MRWGIVSLGFSNRFLPRPLPVLFPETARWTLEQDRQDGEIGSWLKDLSDDVGPALE